MIVLEHLYEVLYSYGIRVHDIEQITPNLFKIEDGRNIYALKKSMLTTKTIAEWEHVYSEAAHNEFKSIVPVYMTKHNQLFVQQHNQIYYLSPWIVTEKEELEKLFEAIGNIHFKTKYEQKIDQKSLIKSFKEYQSICNQHHKTLLQYVEYFEAQHFMAPVELQVCTHFRDIELSIRHLLKRIEKFIEAEKEHDGWSFSLCHGKLTRDHVLSTLNEQYIINWESSSYNYPIFDLVFFFQHEMKKYHMSSEEMFTGFSAYMKQNKLTGNELNLLLIYLLDCTTYLNQVEQYTQNKSDSMIHLTRDLQQQYRVIRFGIGLSKYVEQQYEQLPLDDFNET